MTNEEPTIILQEESNPNFYLDLPYERTEWGLFYSQYKTMNQLQINKQLLHHKLYYRKMMDSLKNNNPYDMMSYVKHIFRIYNKDTDKYERPEIIYNKHKHRQWLQQDNEEYMNYLWKTEFDEYKKMCKRIVFDYYKRMGNEFVEIRTYYEANHIEKKVIEKDHRKEHAKEMVECPCCKAQVVRTNISRHMKTPKCKKTNVEGFFIF